MSTTIKAQTLKKNFAFQTIYQLLINVLPFIVSPYLTRTLGKTELGIYTYTTAIAYYFVLLANLGLERYGQRVIAEKKNDETALRKTFWSLFLINMTSSLFSLGLYTGFIFLFGQDYQSVYFMQMLYVASAMFDVTFLFMGLENFQSVVIRNFVIKILEVVLIFIFVKSPESTLIYTLIIAGSMLLSKLSFLPQVLVQIKPIRLKFSDVAPHIKPVIILFVAQVAIALYTIIDKTLLGIMTTEDNVALYECSNKIVNVPKVLLSVVGTVLYPRACSCMAKEDYESLRRYEKLYAHAVCFIGFASVFGLIGVGDLLAVKYYGEGFEECGLYMMALSPVVLIIGIGEIMRSLYILPNHKDTQYTICLLGCAALNLGLSILLIPYLGVMGAIIGTLAAESLLLVFCTILSRKWIDLKNLLLTMIPYAIIGCIMFGCIFLVRMFLNDTVLHLLLQILIGAVVYCALSAIYLLLISSQKEQFRSLIKEKILGRFRKKQPQDSESDIENHE